MQKTWPIHDLCARAVALALGLSALTATAGHTGDLDVNNAAAEVGSFGLEVTPGANCAAAAEVVVNEESIVGDRTACKTLTIEQGALVGDATFSAGDSVVFQSFTVPAGSRFVALNGQTLVPFAWVRDDTPSGVKRYLASFLMNLDPLTIGGSDRLTVLEGLRGSSTAWFEVLLERDGADKRLLLQARQDDGSTAETPSGQGISLAAGWNQVDLRYEATAGTGVLLVSLNGGPLMGLLSLDNAGGAIDAVRFGAPGGSLDVGTTGSFYLDEFSSFRTLSP